MNPKRHLTAIQRTDSTTVAQLSVETDVLFAIYQRALMDWLDALDRLRDAEMNASNATELKGELVKAERTRAA